MPELTSTFSRHQIKKVLVRTKDRFSEYGSRLRLITRERMEKVESRLSFTHSFVSKECRDVQLHRTSWSLNGERLPPAGKFIKHYAHFATVKRDMFIEIEKHMSRLSLVNPEPCGRICAEQFM